MDDAREVLSETGKTFAVGSVRLVAEDDGGWSLELVAVLGPRSSHVVTLRDDSALAAQVAEDAKIGRLPMLARLHRVQREGEQPTYRLTPTTIAETCAAYLARHVLDGFGNGGVTAAAATVLAAAYYAKPGNEVGGALHVVLDDGNVEDDLVRESALGASRAGDVDGAALGALLLLCSRTQRRVVHLSHGQIELHRAPVLIRSECTGPSATWCPIHGDCRCPHVNGDPQQGRTLEDPACPLHALGSLHADDLAETRDGEAARLELTRFIHEEQGKQEKTSRELRRHLWNLHEAATPRWLQAAHVDEPRAVCAAESPSDSILSLDADGMAVFLREEDAAVAIAARNALPQLIVALDQADVDLAELRAQLRDAQGKITELTRGRS